MLFKGLFFRPEVNDLIDVGFYKKNLCCLQTLYCLNDSILKSQDVINVCIANNFFGGFHVHQHLRKFHEVIPKGAYALADACIDFLCAIII